MQVEPGETRCSCLRTVNYLHNTSPRNGRFPDSRLATVESEAVLAWNCRWSIALCLLKQRGFNVLTVGISSFKECLSFPWNIIIRLKISEPLKFSTQRNGKFLFFTFCSWLLPYLLLSWLPTWMRSLRLSGKSANNKARMPTIEYATLSSSSCRTWYCTHPTTFSNSITQTTRRRHKICVRLLILRFLYKTLLKISTRKHRELSQAGRSSINQTVERPGFTISG